MNTFIEQNKGMLRICYIAAIIIGWLLLALGCLVLVKHFFELIERMDDFGDFKEYYFYGLPWDLIHGIPVGLLALGIGQLIRYVYDENYKAGWILRNVQKLIYTYAVLFGVSIIFSTFMALPYWDHWAEITIRLLGAIIWGTGVILLLIGIALISKRIMPIIEESKTLV
jgi:hypothetical protein